MIINPAPGRAAQRRRALGVGTLAIAAALTVLPSAPAAHAAATSVAPGDEVDAMQASGEFERCTLGYTFTADDGNTYGITAGHCNRTPSRYVRDRTTGAVGHFVLTVVDDDHLADDYGVIAFGHNRSDPTMYGMPVTDVALPNPNTTICHDGIRTGIACGQYDGRLIDNQYCTTGMARSIPGDSGGPVWQPGPGAGATIVGIWLGEHNQADGQHFGRFMRLADIMAGIKSRLSA
ncbi:hypothetical protein FZI85_27815 [Mycobacterium sp. CBMA293]|uniref:Trypsin n=3 Tax=unclassified Mycolicibacterium TaxID=2636767 RepID=A0A1S6GKW3_9MYCO|nr:MULTISPECIES: hypothetical protein [unclassified Mycolicibacterium]AQS22501.1 hypothetical protein pCBMA213_2_00137 [Mycolicibacterium sp. CBMA 213]MUL48401.1 hypothetical protein [Mycolicibacterium sp. CBMA 360]MUL62413.1 hypothetical protein [Mycolicibacterium sp. CBMA 335]MUM14813.1 hypothetical protein [Mycolicibacterium sp. CBMA 293]